MKPRTTLPAALLACNLLHGCAQGGAASVPPTAQKSQQWEGTLVRKGSDLDGWWALVDATGKVWRIDGLRAEDIAQFEKRQHQRLRIQGRRGSDFLATPVILLEGWSVQP